MLNIPYHHRDPHIGDLLAAWLASKGITEQRVSAWLLRVGIRACWCGNARRWLNRLRWLHKFARCAGFKVNYDDGASF